MKAALCKSLDGPAGLVVEDIAVPQPGPPERLHRIVARCFQRGLACRLELDGDLLQRAEQQRVLLLEMQDHRAGRHLRRLRHQLDGRAGQAVLGDDGNGRAQDRRPGPGSERLIPSLREIGHGLHDNFL